MLWIVAALVFLITPLTLAQPAEESHDEELARERNLGLAEYQNEEYAKAAAHFQNNVKLVPKSVVDRINLAVSAVQARNHDQAIHALLEARKIDPSYPHIAYLLGVVYFRLHDLEKARNEFETMLRADPLSAPAHYLLGVVMKKLHRTDDAAKHWVETVRLDPDHGPAHFQLFTLYQARGEHDKAQASFREYMRTKKQGLGPGTALAKVEKSRYLALIIEKVTPQVGQAKEIKVTLRDATKEVGLARARGSKAAELADVDDDGDLDLLLGRLFYRNDGGHFVDATEKAGLKIDEPALCADFGDFDKDGTLDLAVCSGSHLRLYQGKGDGTFEDVSERAGLIKAFGATVPTQVRFVDLDHEGDLDMVVACRGDHGHGPAANRVFRNNGNGTFLDISEPSNLGKTRGLVQAILLSDFDSKNDIDVFLADGAGTHTLYLNVRDGTFKEQAKLAGLHQATPATSALSGDVNNDGLADIVIFGGAKKAVEVWLNRGDARFVKDTSSPVLGRVTQTLGPNLGTLVDIDNDGDLDLVVAGGTSGKGMALFHNNGVGGWTDATDAIMPGLTDNQGTRVVLTGDIDDDGDQDLLLITPKGRVTFLRNDGGNRNHYVRVRLRGRKNNLDGYGAKVWVRQGSFFLMREPFERWIDIGVGNRTELDVVGLRWPTGITQNQLNVRVGKKPFLAFLERPGLGESCPFVYAYDGEQFNFITDILDTTPLGVSLAPGVPFIPNHREAILISGQHLKPERGLLSLRITQELQEITYLDKFRLYAVDHPAGTYIVPNDRFSAEPPFAPFTIHAVSEPLPPLTALDGKGHDIRQALLNADRIYAFDCPPIAPHYPGITTTHELILDPGNLTDAGRVMLFLRGTTLWTDASVNFAVAQNPDIPIYPVSLDVIGENGVWVRVRDDIGLPAGMDKMLPVDLTDIFQSNDFLVRISTNLAVLWDQAFFSIEREHSPAIKPQVTELVPLFADLHYRGFSEVESPDGKLPDIFLYHKLMPIPLFRDVHAGRYTRYGDVIELLYSADDQYIILAPGDEVAVEFPAIALPELPPGWERDYILDADGWIKDGDYRTVYGETVEPLPFHTMSSYPYPLTEHYPMSETHKRYLEIYQTRVLPERPRTPRNP